MIMQLPIQPKIKIRNNNSDNDTMEVKFPITPRAIIWVSDTAKPPPDLPPSLLRSFLFLIQLLPLLGARNFVAHPPPPSRVQSSAPAHLGGSPRGVEPLAQCCRPASRLSLRKVPSLSSLSCRSCSPGSLIPPPPRREQFLRLLFRNPREVHCGKPLRGCRPILGKSFLSLPWGFKGQVPARRLSSVNFLSGLN